MNSKLTYDDFYWYMINNIPEVILSDEFIQENGDFLKELIFSMYRVYDKDDNNKTTHYRLILENQLFLMNRYKPKFI